MESVVDAVAAEPPHVPDEMFEDLRDQDAEELFGPSDDDGEPIYESVSPRPSVDPRSPEPEAVVLHNEPHNLNQTMVAFAQRGLEVPDASLDLVVLDACEYYLEHKVHVHTNVQVASKQPVETQLGMQQILHTRQAVAMVLHVGEEVCLLVGDLASLLQGMDRSTAETILEALVRHEVGSAAVDSFERRVRVAESDGATYNARCEKGTLQRREGWFGLHFICEIHYTSGTHSCV